MGSQSAAATTLALTEPGLLMEALQAEGVQQHHPSRLALEHGERIPCAAKIGESGGVADKRDAGRTPRAGRAGDHAAPPLFHRH